MILLSRYEVMMPLDVATVQTTTGKPTVPVLIYDQKRSSLLIHPWVSLDDLLARLRLKETLEVR